MPMCACEPLGGLRSQIGLHALPCFYAVHQLLWSPLLSASSKLCQRKMSSCPTLMYRHFCGESAFDSSGSLVSGPACPAVLGGKLVMCKLYAYIQFGESRKRGFG